MDEFAYICDRIDQSQFEHEPFEHLLIRDFLSPEHFALLTSDPQIALPPQDTSEGLIKLLLCVGYKVQQFPGCTTRIGDYLKRLRNNRWPVDRQKLEGYGMAFRLADIRDEKIRRLIAFLNGPAFQAAIERKFSITRPTRIDTGIQKYLSGYEISPHPDIRSKCLTYLLNINTRPDVEQMPLHTHLLRFKPEREFIYSFWEKNPGIDRCWVPWDWCTSVKTVSANNSFVIFRAHDRSLHAIKLRYDHKAFQRTQVYGNLWFEDVPMVSALAAEYGAFDITGAAKKPPSVARRMADSISFLLR